MTKKRIAIWLHGGIGTGHFSQGFSVLEKVVSALAGKFDIVVYSQSPPNPGYVPKNFRVCSAPGSGKTGWYRWWSLIKLFRHDHTQKKYDLILAFWGYPAGFIAVCLARWFRTSSVIYLLGSDTAGVKSINHGVFQNPVTKRIALWTYRNATRVVVLTGYQRRQLARHGLQRNIDVIPWGVESSLFYPVAKTRTKELHLLQVAHLNPVKDQGTLLKTLKLILKHRTAKLRIVGFDTLGGSVQALAAELGVAEHVEFLDMQPYNLMPEHYRWADILIQTSLSEGQGLAVSEAAASGVLLAGTRVGLLEDLGESAAVLVDPGDAGNLAKQIDEIAGDDEKWRMLTEHANEWVRLHPFDRTINEITDLLNR